MAKLHKRDKETFKYKVTVQQRKVEYFYPKKLPNHEKLVPWQMLLSRNDLDEENPIKSPAQRAFSAIVYHRRWLRVRKAAQLQDMVTPHVTCRNRAETMLVCNAQEGASSVFDIVPDGTHATTGGTTDSKS